MSSRLQSEVQGNLGSSVDQAIEDSSYISRFQ